VARIGEPFCGTRIVDELNECTGHPDAAEETDRVKTRPIAR